VLRPPRSGGEIGWGGDPGGSVPGGTSGFPVPTAKLGLWVFLAILTVVFTIIIAAYKERMALDDWQAMPDPGLLWVNSGVLLLSCVAMQYAKLRARVGDQRRIWQGLIAGGALAWLFLAGQLWVWHQLSSSGFLVTSNPANSFFYMITGLHGLHLIGGIIVGGIVVHKHWRRSAYARVGLTVDLCAQYWHFLLLVWMAMFVLMLNT
jgi:cytochrome c oxidase subunit 3